MACRVGLDRPAVGDLDLEDRQALRRVVGLSTELEDITEVEYRQVRLEQVVLVGVWTEGTAEEAERSLRELAALAETAGALVLDGVIQRRDRPDPATYIGSGKARELRELVVLTGADTVILHDLSWNPSVDKQAEDRAHRLGATRPVRVIRLITGDSVDAAVARTAERKLALADAVLGEEDGGGGGAGESGPASEIGAALAQVLAGA